MRTLLAGVALALALSACTGDPPDPPDRPADAHPLLVRVGAALGAPPEDPHVSHPVPPECPAGFHRVFANATYDGVRVAVDLSTGPCPGRDGGHYACHGVPHRPGHAVGLRDCFSRTLDDGGILVAGRQHVYQEGTYALAAIRWPGRTCVVSSSPDGGLAVEELARVAGEIRCE